MRRADETSGRVSLELLASGFVLSLAGAMLAAALVMGGRTHAGGEDPPGVTVPGSGRIATVPARPVRSDVVLPPEEKKPGAGPENPTNQPLAQVLRGGGTTEEKLAALKSAWRAGTDPELEGFSIVLGEGAGDENLRLSAALLLARSAGKDPKARALLLSYAETHAAGDAARPTALSAVLQCGTDEELNRCGEILFRETDAEAVADACRTLATNPSSPARALLERLSASHPGSAARHRAEEERTGNYCEEHRPLVIEE